MDKEIKKIEASNNDYNVNNSDDNDYKIEDDEGWITVTYKKKCHSASNQKDQLLQNNIDCDKYDNNYSNLSYSHQDWKPMIITSKKNKITKTTKPKRKKPKSNNFDYNIIQIEKKAEEGDFSIDKINYDLKMLIQQARQKLNLTQKEFAFRCNFPVQLIQLYERGDTIPNPQHLKIMSKVLGIKLSNKKKSNDKKLELLK